MCALFLLVIFREDSVDYLELHHIDQVSIIVDEIKQRITYGSQLMNMCQCPKEPVVKVDGNIADSHFESLKDLNMLYDIRKDTYSFLSPVSSHYAFSLRVSIPIRSEA